MAVYEIRYEEVNVYYFGVEAKSEEEAYERFEEWVNCSDHVYETMREGWNIDSEWSVTNCIEGDYSKMFDDYDVLTEEMYKTL